MNSGKTPREDADVEAFLARKSPLSSVYDALEPVQPPEVLDARILDLAKGAGSAASPKAPPAAKPTAPGTVATKPAPVAASASAAPKPAPTSGAKAVAPTPTAAPPPGVDDDEDDADDVDETPPARRPRWLVPAALAATVLIAIGIGVNVLDIGPANWSADGGGSSRLGSLFAKRARERSDADKAAADAAAEAASRAAEVELAPLPPPPVFELDGPQVEDLDKAIALIRKELVMANQLAAIAEDARAGNPALAPGSAAESPAAKARGSVADVAPPSAPPATPAVASVVQPRDRRLAKILELYDGGNPDLAADSLEIFLRDFEDDPISKRILDTQPRATDVAVE